MRKKQIRRRNKKTPFLKRLFPDSPILRIIFCIAVAISAYIVIQNVYHFAQVQVQEYKLNKEKERLLKEKEELEAEKEALNDPKYIEKKAREDLGLVKPGEVPYVK